MVKPIIDPPKKATFNASEAPFSFAATAVLTFALVAVYIPINPAIPEHEAPTKKEIAVCHPKLKYKARIQTRQNIASLLYSLAINTIAPK